MNIKHQGNVPGMAQGLKAGCDEGGWESHDQVMANFRILLACCKTPLPSAALIMT